MSQTIERNPDIHLDRETVPAGYYLHEGKRLQMSARAAKIPFGVAYRKTQGNSQTTHGLIIRNEDRERLLESLERKERETARKGTSHE